MPSLTPRYRTIPFDNRGVGKSDVPPGPYSIPVMADDAVAVLDAAGVESAHVIGMSMGGYIAQELVLRHPARVRSLVLGCTSCGGREAVRAAPGSGIRDGRAREGAARRRDVGDGAVHLRCVDAARAHRARIWRCGCARGRQRRLFRAVPGDQGWTGSHDRLSAVAAPTLVIHGETDQLVPPENGRILSRAIPHAAARDAAAREPHLPDRSARAGARRDPGVPRSGRGASRN